MECPNCHKNGFVIIGNKRYCSSCGSRLDAQNGQSQVAPRAMSDIKPTSGPAVATSTPAAATAAQLHGQQVGGSPAAPVLDLRAQVQPAAQTASQPQQPPKPPQGPAATPPPPAVVADSAGVNAVTAATAPAAAIASTPAPEPITPTTPSPSVASPASTQPAQSGLHPMVKRFPSHPAVQAKTAPAPPAPTAPSPAVAMPAPTQSEIAPQPVSPAFEHALDTAAKATAPVTVAPTNKPLPGLASAAAAVAAIAIIGGLIWMQNSPKLAFRTAASQAGVQASLPSYVPSSYRQVGPAQVAPGQLTLTFQATNQDSQLQIVQRRTAWDSNSLRENFVSRQSDQYTAVQGQGLTIYLFNDRASWVNHGVWYTVEGTSRLSREQVLKVAYGL